MQIADGPVASPSPLLPQGVVACLCAAWCTTCEAYRPTFDALAQAHPGWRFVWIDIEDQADALGALPGGEPVIDNFPTLLVSVEGGSGFYGTVLPHAAVLSRLLQQAALQALPPLPAAAVPLAGWLCQGGSVQSAAPCPDPKNSS